MRDENEAACHNEADITWPMTSSWPTAAAKQSGPAKCLSAAEITTKLYTTLCFYDYYYY